MLMMVILLSKILDKNKCYVVKSYPHFCTTKTESHICGRYWGIIAICILFMESLSEDKCRHRVESEGEITNFD